MRLEISKRKQKIRFEQSAVSVHFPNFSVLRDISTIGPLLLTEKMLTKKKTIRSSPRSESKTTFSRIRVRTKLAPTKYRKHAFRETQRVVNWCTIVFFVLIRNRFGLRRRSENDRMKRSKRFLRTLIRYDTTITNKINSRSFCDNVRVYTSSSSVRNVSLTAATRGRRLLDGYLQPFVFNSNNYYDYCCNGREGKFAFFPSV